jgi:hypothetical protein
MSPTCYKSGKYFDKVFRDTGACDFCPVGGECSKDISAFVKTESDNQEERCGRWRITYNIDPAGNRVVRNELDRVCKEREDKIKNITFILLMTTLALLTWVICWLVISTCVIVPAK